jgi:predicted Zn finger-like uncharacterized protein
MSLVTQCPKCQSEYEVTADQLKLHDGLVRCGQCNHVFDGLACLKDSLPTLTRKAPEPAPGAYPGTERHAAMAPVLDVPVPPVDAQEPIQAKPSVASPPPTPPTSTPTSTPSASPNPSTAAFSPQPAQPVSDGDGAAQQAVEPPDDGPFIPSVDRLPQAVPQTSGRQEPRFDGAQTMTPSRATQEPSLGSLLHNDGEQRGSGLRAGPSIRVMGEARVRGDDPSAAGRTIPEFLDDEDHDDAFGSRVYWVLGSILLALVLIVQSLVTFRNDIVSAVPAFRPALAALCAPLGCEVSYVRQINRIFIVGSTLQQDPDAATATNESAYDLSFTLQNRGAYPQPWPALLVTLTDASGTAVIKKALMPSEFLPADLLAGPFEARQEVAVDIPLRVRALSISGFELSRFFP